MSLPLSAFFMFLSLSSLHVLAFCFFFFCKQKTAYEITVRDWSSDVCSSDLAFILPMPGGQSLTYTPGEMSNLSALGYTYDDLSAPPSPLVARLERLGVDVT